MNLFTNKTTFFLTLSGIGFLFSFIILRSVLKRYKWKDEYITYEREEYHGTI